MGPFEQDDDPPLLCLSCGGPLRNRDGKFALDIFALIGRGARSMGRQRFKAHDLVFRLAIRTAEIGVRHGASIARGGQGRSAPWAFRSLLAFQGVKLLGVAPRHVAAPIWRCRPQQHER